ncbi:MAG: PKD domain-containing protein [Trebonia sp.]
MARINARRTWRRLPGPVLAALAVIAALTAVPMTASAASASPGTGTGTSTSTSQATAAALTQAFEAGRPIPASALGGIRPGTLHTGTADGTEWAIASFTPSASASKQVTAGFQDGGGTGVFSVRGGGWRLVETGTYGCGDGLPATLKKAWGLADPDGCTAAIALQRAAAQRALAALPAPVPTGANPGAPARPATQAGLDQAIASIALSQVGAGDTPVSTSFATDCNPYSTLTAGFSGNADGCGDDATFGVRNENETWCSDFNKWVWEQAGVTADMNTLNAGSVSFYDWAEQQGETPTADAGTPAVGDSIVFFEPSLVGVYADHVGIVTSVNPDGTINMVNGDFLGSTNIHVEYDTEISLTSWAAATWGAGEEWFIVTPPTAAQAPVPAATMSGPRTAVTGADSLFRAQGSEQGGSISAYYWTFGDGRTSNSTGPDVTHVYSEPGTYTATVTVTSSFGTITTLTRTVTVLGASSAAAAVPSTAVWWATTPVDEYMFVRSAGGLAADTWDGASWLQAAVPGQPSGSGEITALSYPDPAVGDATTPHAYFRAADGSLAQTYLGASGWVTQDLPGQPADNSNIVATTAPGGPAVFYVDAAGQLAESSEQSGSWMTSTLVPGSPALSPASLALADTASGPVLFGVGPAGTIRAASVVSGTWTSRGIPARTTAGGSLAALTTPGGQAAVVYVDAKGAGLAEAAATSGMTTGAWHVTSLPGSPAPGRGLAATTYLLPSAVSGPLGSFPQPPGSLTPSGLAQPLGTAAFYLTASGTPSVTFDDGTGWHTTVLPGTAHAISAVSAYPVAYQPMQLFLAGAAGILTEDSTTGGPSGAWTAQALPGSPSTFPDRVLLYAATPADGAAALTAAEAAGLPQGQVTTFFATAWDDALSGGYLVISAGLAATDALYFNACGWANPSVGIAGSTPFYDVTGPWDTLPGAGAFENAAAATASLAQQRVTDLAYYAVHGALPPGVTSVPAAASPEDTCSGSPS